jgi:glycosyltransferase involved in cell wall biosynthesis
MAQEPLVSVVMPCLDAGRMLRRALSSVIRQTYARLEIVFVDNGSTDGSDRLAQEIGAASGREFRLVVCPERGVNRARTLGFSLARGDYIQWMDADDEMNPDKVALQVAALERERAFDIAFCDWVTRRYDTGDPPLDIPRKLGPVHDQLLRILSGVWYPPHVYLLRRAVAERLHEEKAWWPERPVATDVEYFAFAALLGYRFLHVPGAQVFYSVGARPQQISAVTPYTVRIVSLRDIYARLGAVADRPGVKPRITSRHRALLKQDWHLWRQPPDSVDITKLNGRELRLVHRVTGKTLKLRPREAAIVEVLRTIATPMALAHLAQTIEARGAATVDRTTIIATLERLREAGMLTLAMSTDRIALANDEPAPVDDVAPRSSAAGETRVIEGPLVSVVIPCLNAGRMLPRALNSAIGQTHRNLEIIVVDNGSTDGSDRLAQEIGGASGRDFRFVLCPERGANRARNLGYRMVRGDYVQWFDADDEIDPDKIARQVDALERNRGYDIAYCDWTQRVIYGDSRPTTLVRKALEQVEDQILRILVGVWYPPHTYLLRRSAADQLDREQAWWPDRPNATDWEYFAFAALLGFRFLHVPGAHVYHNRWSSAQISNATRYPEWVSASRALFARFRELAERPTTKPRITAAHRLFLEQNWDLWRLPRGSVDVARIGSQSIRLRHLRHGRQLAISAKEAKIIEVLQSFDAPKALSYFVRAIAEMAPELENDYVAIMTTLERLRAEDVLDRSMLPAVPAGARTVGHGSPDQLGPEP